MRNPKSAKMHLMHAHKAVKDGDGAKARHHIGHALSAAKEGPPMASSPLPSYGGMPTQNPQEEAAESPAPAKPSLLDRLRAMRGK